MRMIEMIKQTLVFNLSSQNRNYSYIFVSFITIIIILTEAVHHIMDFEANAHIEYVPDIEGIKSLSSNSNLLHY